jgi:hypothetical protein
MFVHLCFGLAVGEGLDGAEAAWGWTAVEPDDRAVDVLALVWLAVVWPVVACVLVVAAPAAVRLRARPPPRTAAPTAVPTSGRKILTQFSPLRTVRIRGRRRPRGGPRSAAAISTPGESGPGLGASYHDTLNWPAGTLSRNPLPPRPSPTPTSAPAGPRPLGEADEAGPELANPVG